jgi:hypothetical protein
MMPRFILIERCNGRIFGDTDYPFDQREPSPKRLTPLKAASLIQSTICDYYPYDYRKTTRDDPAATFDVYRAPPDYPQIGHHAPGDAVERDCKYVATLARCHSTVVMPAIFKAERWPQHEIDEYFARTKAEGASE